MPFGSDPNGASWVSSGCCQACAGLLPRDPQEGRRLGASLARSRLVAVRPGSHAVTGDRTKNNRDYALAFGRGPLRQQAVQGRQRLARPLQAHLAWHHPVPQGGVGHGRTEHVGDQVGLDLPACEPCVSSGTDQTPVPQDVDEGTRAGITATPAFCINGRLLSGAQPLESFTRVIEDELARVR